MIMGRRLLQVCAIFQAFSLLNSQYISFTPELVNLNFSSSLDIEFSKDIASLAIESTLESRCNGNIFISTRECDDHISLVTESLSNWAPPVILISYETPFHTLSKREIEKWQYYLRWKDQPCSLVFICDLSRNDKNITMGFLDYPKLIRHLDQVIYFSDFDTDFNKNYGWRVIEAEKKLLVTSEILMSIKVINRTKNSESLMRISSVCTYCTEKPNPTLENEIGTWKRNSTMLSQFFSIFKFQNNASFNNFKFKIGYLNYKPHFYCDIKTNDEKSNKPKPLPGKTNANGNSKGKPSNRSKSKEMTMARLVRKRISKETVASGPMICTGVEWEMLQKISKSLHFSFDLYNFTTQGHGVVYGSKNITGMIGAIQNSTIDLAIGGVSISSDRLQVVDFTKIFSQESIVFVVEKRHDIYILGIWLAFQPVVWPIIILTILAVSIVFKFILKKQYISLTYGFQFSISSLVGQPLTHKFMTRKTRCLMKLFLGIWWFVCITIGTLYNTSLITSLINPVKPDEPESLHDLLGFGYNFIMGCKQGAVFELLQQENERSTHVIGTKNIAFKQIKDRLVSFEDQWTNPHGKIAYVMEESAVEEINWKKNRFSNIKIIKERLFLTGYGWAIKFEAPYKDKIDTALGRLASAGLTDYWYSLYSHKDKEPQVSKFKLRKKLGQVHLSLEILQGAFIFLMLGCGLACIIFLIELWYKHYSFRFFTIEEIKTFCKKWMVKLDLNLENEILRVGQQTMMFVAPIDIQRVFNRSANLKDSNSYIRDKEVEEGPRKMPELQYLK